MHDIIFLFFLQIQFNPESECAVAELPSDTAAVTESAGIVESEEESDEEWNYIKGEQQKELKVKESHAISQAIAESQEACSDVSPFNPQNLIYNLLLFSFFSYTNSFFFIPLELVSFFF